MAFCLATGRGTCPRERLFERLVDWAALFEATDYTRLIAPYEAAAGSASRTLAASSGMLLACAVAMPVVPNLIVAVVGLGLFVWSIFQTACAPLPTIAFMGLLCITSVFGAEHRETRWKMEPAAAVVGAGATRSKGPSGKTKSPAGKSPGKSPAKKRR
ncbi:hypothetical protein TSOC_000584 [Tetrabaena socialis]|uniref:Uncharacterized protein n=1 Tax=Tetrabaena socialis TaxID=47790 RepID=A0A2J8AJ11_9CHLO|nr:hypothetical protein TSOC_000584 [Tetrabaena socialis]|eukprot:PNH12498.1 hypothetical protein TSOC_000584 [Tetrabaena socialis]